MSNPYADFPAIHLPFFVGEQIRMIRKPWVKAVIVEARSMRASVTGAWYRIQNKDGICEFISGHEWKKSV